MNVFHGYLDKVAGDAGYFYTRKAIQKGLYEEPITHRRMFKYAFDRNSIVQVTQSINTEDPDYQTFQDHRVHMELKDKLSSDAIVVFFDSKKPVRLEVKEGLTGTHGGYIMKKVIRFIATITVPLANVLNQIPQKKHFQLATKPTNEK